MLKTIRPTIWEWTHVEQIGPMGHQGDLFDVRLSRGNFWGFIGVNISSKVWGCHDIHIK